MSDYNFRPGGSLKLKAGVSEGGVKKYVCFWLLARLYPDIFHSCRKKKKSEKSKLKDKVKELEEARDSPAGDEGSEVATPTKSGRDSPAAGSSSERKTDAERRFEEVQRRRVRSESVCYFRVLEGLFLRVAC